MISNGSYQRAEGARGGYVLILVVMLLFGIMAMAALVIDLGFARLTQRQMQTAVDAASLEGLRYRDELWPEASNPNATDFDLERRRAASLTAARMFDDNLLADMDDPMQFGAGPMIEFSGGIGDPALATSQDMSIPEIPVYKPIENQQIQLNMDNAVEGDMLAGSFAADALTHTENGDYQRSDFTPSRNGDAFLVRMRRTNEDFSGSVTSSGGPPLPYLFARGSLFQRGSQANLSDGIQTRATAIAHAQPVVYLGAQNPRLLGIAIEIDLWDQGAQYPWSSTSSASSGMVGEAVEPNLTAPTDRSGYVAIYSSRAFDRVIGFGYVAIDAAASTVTKLPFSSSVPQIAVERASAVFCQPLDSSIPSTELASVFRERTNRLVKANRSDILLAPVSGR